MAETSKATYLPFLLSVENLAFGETQEKHLGECMVNDSLGHYSVAAGSGGALQHPVAALLINLGMGWENEGLIRAGLVRQRQFDVAMQRLTNGDGI